jgi:hypothetical protein
MTAQLLEDEDWRERALCAEVDPELFFSDQGVPPTEAKSICARCDVQSECLEWALDNDEEFGIFGGLTPRERRREAKRRKRARLPQSGVPGVIWDQRRDKWIAAPIIDGEKSYLGGHDTVDQAVIAIADWKERRKPLNTSTVAAVADVWNEPRKQDDRRKGCGTEAGYRYHHRHKTEPCARCRAAHAEDRKRYRTKDPHLAG